MYTYRIKVCFKRDVATDEKVMISIRGSITSSKVLDVNSFILPPHPGTALSEEVRPLGKIFEFDLIFHEDLGEVQSIQVEENSVVQEIFVKKA